jgi:polyhydroxyalkanoate synthase
MHTEFLERLYLKNELACGGFTLRGQGVDLRSLQLPMFVVGTETDHIAPWQSVYQVRELTRSTDYTFVLTNGGHNAGIVSEPQHPRRRYRMLTWSNPTETLPPEQWAQVATSQTGSWWLAWQRWLVQHSGPKTAKPPAIGNAARTPLEDAPGRYVHE